MNDATEARNGDPKIAPSLEDVARARRIALASRRALEEAEARRRAAAAETRPEEIGGRGGLEPTRYGDWESKGVASDF
jgi:hypothetical protein